MRQTTIDKIEVLILDGVPLRDALVSVGVPNSYMKRVATFDYNRLMRLARGVKAAKKGETIRAVSKVVGIGEDMLRRTYPSLWELCRRLRRESKLSRLAYVAETLATSGDVSLATIATNAGEGIGMVYQAWNRYYGLEDVNQYGLKSKV